MLLVGWTEGLVWIPTIACLSVLLAPGEEHLFKRSLKLWSGCKIGLCVCVNECMWFGLHLLIWSWHYGVKLFFFFFLSSCALQVAPTIWKQALKTRPSLSHQNGMKIYPHTQLPCRSLLSHPQTTREDNTVVWVEWNTEGFDSVTRDTRCGILGWTYTWKCEMLSGIQNQRCNYMLAKCLFYPGQNSTISRARYAESALS